MLTRFAFLLLLTACAAEPPPASAPRRPVTCPAGSPAPPAPRAPRTVESIAAWATALAEAHRRTEVARAVCARRLAEAGR